MTFIIRDVPPELHRRIKIEAATQGKTIQTLVKEIIAAYLDTTARTGKEGVK